VLQYIFDVHSHTHSYCTVHDFEPIAPLISYALVDVMRCSAAEHPVLVTEPAWNTAANRERMAEIMFEEFQVPAFYIANTGVLNA
jgi:actin-like protein 6B